MNWSDELDAHDASFDDDALAVDATEYVATRAEPFWKSLLGALCMFVLIGLGWVLALLWDVTPRAIVGMK